MDLDKVPYTKRRSGKYHLNIPIHPAIRSQYGGKTAFERTTGSSDPEEAKRQVRAQRFHMDEQIKEAQRLADQAKLKGLLDPTDAATVDAMGGSSQLPKIIEELRHQMAFLVAGQGASDTIPDYDIDTNRYSIKDPKTGLGWNAGPQQVNIEGEYLQPDAMLEIQKRADEAANRAFMETVTAEIRRYKANAATLGEEVPPAPAFLEEGVSGLRDLAAKMAGAKGYTKQNRDNLMYTVRRWIELHGDIPLKNFTRAHISEFSDALKGLPTTREKRVQAKGIREAIALAKAEGLETMGDKMRHTRCDHIKTLASYAVNHGVMSADPFAGFKIVKPKVNHSAKGKIKRKPFTPEQVRKILPHCTSTFHPDTLDYWAPIISAYTGARREEIAQLYASDVSDWGNNLTITITDEGEDQSVKNKHSYRTIPVPPILLDAGFGGFVARRRQAGGKMLFLEDFTNKNKSKTLREVEPSERGRYSETYGERFSRKVRKPLGLDGQGLVFHSFRHSWTDAARRAWGGLI
jgi:integrase